MKAEKTGGETTRQTHSSKSNDCDSADVEARGCAVERQCGACQHLSVSYSEQLRRKEERIAELFREVADRACLLPIKGMENPYHYRNKVVSPYARGKKLPSKGGRNTSGAYGARGGKGKHGVRQGGGRASRAEGARYEILCGMYAAGTHRIVPTDECLIENEEAKRIILAVRGLMPKFGLTPYDEDTGSGFLRHAVVRVGHTSGEILVTLVTNGREFPGSRAFCRELVRRCPGITTVAQVVNTRFTNVIMGEEEHALYGPGFILDRLCGLSFRISPRSFYQVNASQTEVLYHRALELAAFSGDEHVIDAYCGTGTIGLVAAKNGAAHVVGVDSVPSAIHDARANARHNGVDNASFVEADAGAFMRELASAGEQVQVVLMDPPRAGASEEFLAALAELAPERVIYISCNPETQVRDIRRLLQRGYAVSAVQPVDMFPHTDHIEVIVKLCYR